MSADAASVVPDVWLVCPKCGWIGKAGELNKVECLTDADSWYECPSCGIVDGSNMTMQSMNALTQEQLAATLKSRNGDTLNDLNARLEALSAQVEKARDQLAIAERTVIKPLRDTVERLTAERQNISCRLNIWWRENRERYQET